MERLPSALSGFTMATRGLSTREIEPIKMVNLIGFTKIFLAGVLAFTGYSYAELFVAKVAENRKELKRKPVYSSVNKQSGEKGLQGKYTCKVCGKSFKSQKALNGHMKVH